MDQTPGKPSRMLSILAWAGMAALLLARLNGNYADPDLFGYLGFGRLWQQTGTFPWHDVFAYTPVKDLWVYHEWLTGVFFQEIVSRFGFTGLKLLKYGLGLGTAWLMYRTARLRGSPGPAIFFSMYLISPVFSIGFASVRAQVLTNLFFVLTIFLLEYRVVKRDWLGLGLLPVIFIPWANFHGGFPAGLGLIALYALGQWPSPGRAAPFAAAFGASLLATLVNPYGLAYWTYLGHALTMPRPEISEWLPVWGALAQGYRTPSSVLFLLALGAGLFFFRPGRERSQGPLLVLLATAGLGCLHVRHQILFFLALGPYLPRHMQGFWLWLMEHRPQIAGRWSRVAALAGPLACAVLLGYFAWAFLVGRPLELRAPQAGDPGLSLEECQPVETVAYMKARGLGGMVLTEFQWGEYVSWELYPAVKVAFDGRYETVYPEAVAKAYFDLMALRSGAFLRENPPDMLLLQPSSPLGQVLRKTGQWREIHADQGAVLLVRADWFGAGNKP